MPRRQKVFAFMTATVVLLLAIFGTVMAIWLVAGKAQLTWLKHSATKTAQPKPLTVKSEQHTTTQITLTGMVCDISLEQNTYVTAPDITIQGDGSPLKTAVNLTQAKSLAVGDWRRFSLTETETVTLFTSGATQHDTEFRLNKIIAVSLIAPTAQPVDYCAPRPMG